MGEGLATASQDQTDSGTIDLGGIASAVMRNKGMILGVTLATLVGSVAFVSLVKARYTAEAKVLIENQEGYFTRPDKSSPDLSPGPDPEAVLSQVQLIQSRDLARSAIRDLGLVGKPEFDPQAGGGGFFSRITELLGVSRSLTDRSPEDRIFEAYFADLTVFPVPKSRVVSIEFVSNDPETASRAANTIADLYISLQSKAKRDSARQFATTLEGQISALKVRLAEAESRAEKFRLKSGLLIGANNLTITAQQLSDINAQLSAARASQAEVQAKAKLIRDMLRQGRLNEVPDIANNDLVRRISEQRVTLRAQLALESRALLPGHPRIKELSAQIADLENELRAAADRASRTLENDARIAGSRVENLTATLEGQKKVSGVANNDDVTQREYDSETKLLKEQLESASAKYQEAVARQNAVSTPADARVVSRAVAPIQATFPKKVPIILLSTLAGLTFSLGGVVAGEMLSGRSSGASYPLPTPVPAPAEIAPLMVSPRRRVDWAHDATDLEAQPMEPHQSATEPSETPHVQPVFASANAAGLAERIGAAQQPGQAIVSLVTCPADPFEASSMAIALARALAESHRTILVNLDAHARSINQLAKENSGAGLVDLLASRASFAEVIHRDTHTRLHVLAHGRGLMLAGTGLDEVLDALCETYHHVVLCAPPLADSILATTLAPYADFAVLVTAEPASLEAEAAHVSLSKAGPAQVLVVAGDPLTQLANVRRSAVPA